jgi:hypothetical protein
MEEREGAGYVHIEPERGVVVLKRSKEEGPKKCA